MKVTQTQSNEIQTHQSQHFLTWASRRLLCVSNLSKFLSARRVDACIRRVSSLTTWPAAEVDSFKLRAMDNISSAIFSCVEMKKGWEADKLEPDAMDYSRALSLGNN